ncbi:MAG: glycogen synthase [Acidobacteria bacterium]|jgi:ADP-glucose type glycogen/starch synthase|nr:glycogen synthase [Acidobacteriota bacterium]MCU0253884.1 glycogen synthase [Acidobacteriota bacterium]
MHIVHVSPEMAPFAKVGGLGDVVGSLPPAQARDGHQVTVVLPAYQKVLAQLGLDSRGGRPVGYRIDGREVTGTVQEIWHQGVRLLLVGRPEYFDRPGIYGDAGGSYWDNGERFGWFCGAALSALRDVPPAADVILAHDWPAGLVPVFLRAHGVPDDPLEQTASAMVLHNVAHQGLFPGDLAARFGIPPLYLGEDALESAGAISFLKGGVALATIVITVSPTYAREILWPGYGEGLEELLLARGDDLHGILNGLDVDGWNPATDTALPRSFSAEDPSGKAAVKAALQQELGFRVDSNLPLFGMVSRIDPQKGVDLVEQVAPLLVERSGQIVVLGTGQRRLIEPLLGLAAMWRQSVAVVERFDEPLAHRIYGGSDFFLMPSRFEPCGLGQMAALRYGTLPIVRRTGGLADTVVDLDEHPEAGTGFVFEHADAAGLSWACERALRLFAEGPRALEPIRRRAMELDFSWDRSARVYDHVLERAALREKRRVLLEY